MVDLADSTENQQEWEPLVYISSNNNLIYPVHMCTLCVSPSLCVCMNAVSENELCQHLNLNLMETEIMDGNPPPSVACELNHGILCVCVCVVFQSWRSGDVLLFCFYLILMGRTVNTITVEACIYCERCLNV